MGESGCHTQSALEPHQNIHLPNQQPPTHSVSNLPPGLYKSKNPPSHFPPSPLPPPSACPIPPFCLPPSARPIPPFPFPHSARPIFPSPSLLPSARSLPPSPPLPPRRSLLPPSLPPAHFCPPYLSPPPLSCPSLPPSPPPLPPLTSAWRAPARCRPARGPTTPVQAAAGTPPAGRGTAAVHA